MFLINLLGALRLVKLFCLMTRWFLLTIEASNLYRSVVGYSIIHNHSENFFSGKYMLDWRMYVTFVELLLNWLRLKSHNHLHIFLYKHALQTFKLTTGGGQCTNKLKYFLWKKKVLLQSLVSCLLNDETESRKSSNTQICKKALFSFRCKLPVTLYHWIQMRLCILFHRQQSLSFQYADSLYVVINLKNSVIKLTCGDYNGKYSEWKII